MTDDEREARNWLGRAVGISERDGPQSDIKHRATILSLLDGPRLPRPEDVPPDVVLEMADALGQEAGWKGAAIAAYSALYDHYTKPPAPVRVEAWAVTFSDSNFVTELWDNKEDAEKRAATFKSTKARIVHLVAAADDEPSAVEPVRD